MAIEKSTINRKVLRSNMQNVGIQIRYSLIDEGGFLTRQRIDFVDINIDKHMGSSLPSEFSEVRLPGQIKQLKQLKVAIDEILEVWESETQNGQ